MHGHMNVKWGIDSLSHSMRSHSVVVGTVWNSSGEQRN
jgi:hypothetical protein